MGWSSEAVTAVELVGPNFVFNKYGCIFYDGPAAADNMLMSLASAPFTDDYGNQVPGGETWYLEYFPGFATNTAFTGEIQNIANTDGDHSQQGTWFVQTRYWQDQTQFFTDVPVVGQEPGAADDTPEIFHEVTALPSGWTGTLGYTYVPLGAGMVLVEASVSSSAGTSGTLELFTLPADYTPVAQRDFACRVFTASAPATAEWGGRVTTGGIVEAVGLPASTTGVFFSQLVRIR